MNLQRKVVDTLLGNLKPHRVTKCNGKAARSDKAECVRLYCIGLVIGAALQAEWRQ